jgi:hypothetical protein
MALASGTVAVGTAATQINGASANPMKLHISNNDNTDTVYLGAQEVTINNGLVLQKLERIVFELNAGERIFAVSSKAGHIISYITQTF